MEHSQGTPPARTDSDSGLKPGAAAAASDPVNHPRILASALDGLVRSCRTESPAVPQIAARILERWRTVPDTIFRLDATSLHVGEEEVLSAQDEEGRWLLPAFMAGVKTVGLGEDPTPEDLGRLAAELAALGPNMPSICRLRDWLWSEGAEGFEVVLDYGFAEGLDAALIDHAAQRQLLETLRVEAAVALSALSERIASRELDAAAARDEFLVPLDAYARAAEEDRLRLSAEDADALAAGCDDALFWVDAQVLLAFAHPQLQTQVPPERMARRVLSLVKGGGVGRFLNFLAEMRRRREPYARELLAALDREEAGETVAAGLCFDDATLNAMAPLLVAQPTPLTRGLTCRLVERAVGRKEDLHWLARLMSAVGFEAFCAKIDASRLTEHCALTVCRLLVACRAPLPPLAGLLARTTPATGIRMASALPPDALFRLKQPVVKLLAAAPLKEAEAFLDRLLADSTHDWAQVFGEVLLSTAGAVWPLPLVRRACDAVARKGYAARYLVPLIYSREAGDDVKLTALRFVEQHPEAATELSAPRLRDLFKSRELRDRLKSIRRQGRDE